MKSIIAIVFLCLLRFFSFAQSTKDIEQEIVEMMKVYNVPGLSVAVVKDQRTILCKGFGLSNIDHPTIFDENTPARLASATKFLTGLAFLAMAEKEVIDLNAPLKTYLNNIPPDWKEIPLWRMMNHTSGIPTPDSTAFAKMNDAEQRRINEQQLFELINKLPLDFKPGEKWRYQQTAFVILSMIISKKTGKSWFETINETILKPSGMVNTVHNEKIKYTPETYPKNYEYRDGKLMNMDYFYAPAQSTGAGYNTTASDMAKMLLALNGNKIVSLDFLVKEIFIKERMYPISQTSTYSITTEIKTFGKYSTIGHSGGPDIANIRYCPEKKIGVVVLANRSTTGISEELTNRILRRLLLAIPFNAQQKPIVYAIRKKLPGSGYAGLLTFVKSAKKKPLLYDFQNMESSLNELGYSLLYGEKKPDDAIKIFRLNVSFFPNSFNVHDSLGEAYMLKGDKTNALRCYKRCLELDGGNENAKKMIDKLER